MKQIINTIKDKKNRKFKDIKKIFKLFSNKSFFKFFKKSLIFFNVSKDEYDLDIFDDIRKTNPLKENFVVTNVPGVIIIKNSMLNSKVQSMNRRMKVNQ